MEVERSRKGDDGEGRVRRSDDQAQGSGRTAGAGGDLPKEVLAIYWAKNMYWRAGKPERFVRPVRWVVAMLDSAVVPLEIAGIKAGECEPRASDSCMAMRR